MQEKMCPRENAISYAQNKPIIKPSHDATLGLNKTEVINRPITKEEYMFIMKNVKSEKFEDFHQNMMLSEVVSNLGVDKNNYIDSQEIVSMFHRYWFKD